MGKPTTFKNMQINEITSLASKLTKEGDYAEAENLFELAMKRHEKESPDSLELANTLANYIGLLLKIGSDDRAIKLRHELLRLRERILGAEHPDTAKSIKNLADSYFYKKNDCESAEPLYRRLLAIREKVLGLEHPDTAEIINAMADLMFAKGAYDSAEQFYRQALAIREKVLGPEHLDTANTIAGLSHILSNVREDYTSAESLTRRVLAIREKVLGIEHPLTAKTKNALDILLKIKRRCNRQKAIHHQHGFH